MSARSLRTDVLVVGAGVVGTILALELARSGVSSIVIERTTTAPRYSEPDLLGVRSMDVLRWLGLAAQIGAMAEEPAAAGISWSRGPADPPILVSGAPAGDGGPGPHPAPDETTPGHPVLSVSGARLVARLRATVRANPLIDLREGWTFTELRSHAGRALAMVLDGGRGERHAIDARFVAGCDGAHSTVRCCLEVGMDEFQPPVPHISVYFRDPGTYLRPDGPATLVVGDRTVLVRNADHGWVAQVRLGGDELLTVDPVALLRTQLGVPVQPPVDGVRQWDDALAVAQSYGREETYLVGESAHRFHPVDAFLDASISDAADLGWKLAAVVNGWGGPALLSSYEGERRPRALIGRELLARDLETRRRFGRLVRAGASRELLAEVLRQERYSNADLDLPALGRYRGPPAVCEALNASPDFTLLDLTEDGGGRTAVDAARRRGMPLRYLSVSDPVAREQWDRRLVLIRPDHQVAWHDDHPPVDWTPVLGAASGHQTG